MSQQCHLKHIAIIMDGNGRWAENRSHRRIWGHVRGSQVVSSIVEEADELGVKSLTLYAFSTENWSRPKLEVKALFLLLKKFLKKERPRIIANDICFKIIGRPDGLPDETVKLIEDLTEETKNNKGLRLTFAFGYGGRNELIDAFNSFSEKNPGKKVTEESLSSFLYDPLSGDVDLLIRTGGDQRISNFLLWQVAYAELFFTKTKWPDFTSREFKEIVDLVGKRDRRFGTVSNDSSFEESKVTAKRNLNESILETGK